VPDVLIVFYFERQHPITVQQPIACDAYCAGTYAATQDD
jgi:hypothetical protein